MNFHYLNYFKESPMFYLSLTSKELFHSNFISWIIINYKDECSKLFSRFLPGADNPKITYVTREEKNKDIVIYFEIQTGKKSTLVIENKVKSIPNYEQLRKYTTNDASEQYLLLSLIKPTFLTNNNAINIQDLDREWVYLNYGDLADLFEEIIHEIEQENKYHALIVNDYIKVAQGLNCLTNDIYEHTSSGVYDFYQPRNKLIPLLREIRLHDFYLKLNHEIIAGEIYRRIKDELPDSWLVPNKNWKTSISQEVFVGSGFTRGSGISEVKYVIGEKHDSPIIVGVQIQGDQFRLFIESKKGSAIKIAEELYRSGLWFDFNILMSSGISVNKEYPESRNSAKTFNTYSNEFYYRSAKLKSCKVSDLIDVVVEYVHYIHKNKEIFMNRIN